MGNRTFLIARECGREALSLSSGECIVLLTLVYYFEVFFDAETNGPLTMYWLNRSIVHTNRMHVSEVPCSGAVSAHTTYVPRQSPN